MSKVRDRRNEMLQEKRVGNWTPEKEIKLQALESRIRELDRVKMVRSNFRVQREYEKHAARLVRKETPNIPDLQRRMRELTYERDNDICWTTEKHYTLEAIHERIRRFNAAKKQLATMMAGKG